MAKKIQLKLEYAVLYADRTILVKTPKRYTVTAYRDYYKEDMDKMEDMANELNKSAMFLYNCLTLLGISIERAKKHDFSLNTITGERLRDMAINSRTLSHEFKMLILNYRW